MKAVIARKLGMTSAITEDGSLSPITLLSVEPNVITQIKTTETDGYNAVQLGSENAKKISKPQKGHFKKSKATPKLLREFIIDENGEGLNVGDQFGADIFNVGDEVKVTGTSKGKGFAGTIKRHNFHRGRKTHGGQSYRRPGSIGSMYPQKIFKGKKMAGQMGDQKVTVSNLKIALVKPDENVIGVIGAVPGPRKGIVLVKAKSGSISKPTEGENE